MTLPKTYIYLPIPYKPQGVSLVEHFIESIPEDPKNFLMARTIISKKSEQILVKLFETLTKYSWILFYRKQS
jgi:hypothetical protein